MCGFHNQPVFQGLEAFLEKEGQQVEAGLHTHTEATVHGGALGAARLIPQAAERMRVLLCVSQDPHFEDGASCLSYPCFSGLPASSFRQMLREGAEGDVSFSNFHIFSKILSGIRQKLKIKGNRTKGDPDSGHDS